MTDDLIARLNDLADWLHDAGSHVSARLVVEAAEALAAASRPSKKDDDLDSRVAGERLPEGQDLPRQSQRDDAPVRLATAIRLAQEATNGWACHAKRQIEHDDISRLHREIANLIASASPAAPPPWQPIETALKDRTSVLGYTPFAPCIVGDVFWNPEIEDFARLPDADAAIYVTHWLPLPSPPASQQERSKESAEYQNKAEVVALEAAAMDAPSTLDVTFATTTVDSSHTQAGPGTSLFAASPPASAPQPTTTTKDDDLTRVDREG